MIPVRQLVVGDGKDGRPVGDCTRACIASIFELRAEDVPHFVANESRWFRDLLEWLRPMSLTVEHASHAPTDSPPYWPAGWWIATVLSENFEGATHAVVMRGTFSGGDENWMRVAHDPSPHPRRTPYVFVGRYSFVTLDAAAIARRAGVGRRFPIQGDVRWSPLRPGTRPPGTVPWGVAELAYAAYVARFGRSQSLERLAERGGFGHGEMDLFAPGWRDSFEATP